MKRPAILIVDDDPVIAKFMKANLEARGYGVALAIDGDTGIGLLEEMMPDLVILDIMLPGMDGVEVCRRIREWSQVPIIMLTARDNIDGKIELLDLGADDYISKPFGLEELMARIKAVLRRNVGEVRVGRSTFISDDMEIDFDARQVEVSGRSVDLSQTEYDLLRELSQNAGKVMTHQMLLSRIWGPQYGNEMEYLRVYISRLRRKIEENSRKPKHILTMSGVGYSMKKPS